jgi:hypothetical protein
MIKLQDIYPPTAQGEHMSLEETLAELIRAIDGLTDSNQHLAATYRAAQPLNLPAAAPKPEGEKRPPGRPPGSGKKKEEPPASPLEQAGASPGEKNSAASSPSATSSPAPEGTYADLQVLVPKLAESKGRSAAVAIFQMLGVASGKELQEKQPGKIGEAVKLFRAALGE